MSAFGGVSGIFRAKVKSLTFFKMTYAISASRAGTLSISQGIVMLIQFLVGGIVTVCNITIHALVMTVVVQVARATGTKKEATRRCV